MIATVRETPEGLTIARVEETRHAFLGSMRDAGAEFFWIWPVVDDERLAAMLIVGYHGEPARDPAVADYGAAFAERLRAALSNSARDERLYRQAHYDPLTQLPNRALFRDRLAQELAAAASGLTRGALMYVDLDHFKRVNDTLGHSAGDQLLSIVAHRLKACTKEGDTVARLGGDEFTVLLRNVGDAETARQIADRVIRSLALPANLGGRDYQMRASVGVTLFPDDGTELEDVIRQADLAMYRAKAQGRGRAIFFEREMKERRPSFTDSGLHRALRRREFALYYQPQFSLADGRLCGVEALLRWQTRYDGIKLPGEFIPAAEHSGLITDIGGFVLDSACAQYAEWVRAGIAPRSFSVNVSVQQLKDPNFVTHGAERAAPARHHARPASSSSWSNPCWPTARSRSPWRAIAALGVRLALDDFGTGYSSLNYLRRYPVHTVKLDRSFLDEVPQNDSAGALVESVITMAHTLGKRVTAEGVESGGAARVPARARLRGGAGLLPGAAHVGRRAHRDPRIAPARVRRSAMSAPRVSAALLALLSRAARTAARMPQAPATPSAVAVPRRRRRPARGPESGMAAAARPRSAQSRRCARELRAQPARHALSLRRRHARRLRLQRPGVLRAPAFRTRRAAHLARPGRGSRGGQAAQAQTRRPGVLQDRQPQGESRRHLHRQASASCTRRVRENP